MKNNILISREKRIILHRDNDFIGMEGENLQEVLAFKIDPHVEGNGIIEVIFPNEEKGFIEVEHNDGTYELPIKSSLLTQKGLIKFQLRILQDSQEIFKSEIMRFEIRESINATQTIPEQYPTWIDNLEKIKTDLEQAETERQNTFNSQMQEAEEAISNIEDMTDSYNKNADTKVKEYNINHNTKLEEYNANHNDKLKEYNTNHDDKIQKYNDNAQDKMNEYNEKSSELLAKIEELEIKNTEQDTEVQALQEENKLLKSQIPSDTVTENIIHLSDSSNMQCTILPLGESKQEGEPSIDNEVPIESVGENINLYNEETALLNTYIRGVDGVIGSSSLTKLSDFIEIDEDEYTINYTNDENKRSYCLYNANKEFITGGDQKVAPYVVTRPSEAKYIRFAMPIDSVDAKLEKGSIATGYSPYGQGSAKIEVCNENILDLMKIAIKISGTKAQNKMSNSIELISTSSWSNFYFVLDNLQKNKDYTIFADFLETIAESSKVGISVYGNTLNSTNGMKTIKANDGNISKDKSSKFSVAFNVGEYPCIIIRFWNNSTSTAVTEGNSFISITNMELKVGTEESEYVEYQGYTKSVPMQKPFRSVGEVRDEFVNIDGKKYENHPVARYIFTGSESFTLGGIYESKYRRFAMNYDSSLNVSRKILNTIGAESNYFTGISNYQYATAKNDCWINEQGRIHFGVDIAMLSEDSVDGFKEKLTELYNAGTPVYVDYVLAEPELIPCTEEQEKILNSFYTYKNITNINSDSIGKIKVVYSKDLNIQNKNLQSQIDELKQAIVALGGV